MKSSHLITALLVLLMLSGCSPTAPTEPPPAPTAGPAAAIAMATASPPAPATDTPVPTATAAPTPPPPPPGKAEPWRPALPAGPCMPAGTRTCRVLFVLPAQYYAESGRSYLDEFRDAGYAVVVASNAPRVVEVCENTVRPDQPAKDIPVDLSLAEVRAADYDAVILIGGLGCQDQWHDEETHRIARDAAAEGRVVGAAGCASTILAYAGLLQGRAAAVCSDSPPVKHGQDYCEILAGQGAVCSPEPIVRDGPIVTAQQKSPYFVPGLIQVIQESGPAAPALLLQAGAQTFEARGTFQAGLGDLDGDGDLDAVFANPMRHNSEVWLNDGRGTLVDTGQQLTQYGHGVGVADFDGDGDLDAFIACHQFVTPSKVYLNDGSGLFRDSGQDLGDSSISAAEVNLLDLNGDGHMDVHVLYYSPGGLPDRVYVNDGRAAFADSGLALEEETIAWGDLDADGDVDYFGKRWGRGYVVRLNDGSGSFEEGWQMADEQSTLGGVALADLDGDGDLDAVVANGSREAASSPALVLWNDGGGRFADSGQRLNETLGSELAAGDLDGDGDVDVFVANMGRPAEVWLNDGSGRLADSGLRLPESGAAGNSTKASLGDLDADGDLDVFVGDLSGAPRIWLNNSAGAAPGGDSTPAATPTAAPAAADTSPPAVKRLIEWADLRTGYGPAYSQAWSPDGSRLVTADYDLIQVWDMQTRRNAGALAGHTGFVWGLAWSPGDGSVLASASQDGSVRLWDVAAYTTTAVLDTGPAMAVAWAPDGRQLAVGTLAGEVQLWDVATAQKLAAWPSPGPSLTLIISVAWSPDGETVASGELSGHIYLWEAATGRARTAIEGYTQNRCDANGLAWSPDGRTLASAHQDGRVRLWDGETGEPVRTIEAHSGWARGVAWSPSGQWLASTGQDKRICLWDPNTGQEYAEEHHNRLPVWSVSWSPDGRQVASGAGAYEEPHVGATIVWRVP